MLTGINQEPLYRLIYRQLNFIVRKQICNKNIFFDIEVYLLDNLYNTVEICIIGELIRSIN